MEDKKKKWIKGADLKKGALHHDLGIPESKDIPEETLREAARSKDKTIARRARLALTMKGFKNKDGKPKHRSGEEIRSKLYGSKKEKE
jgi:hypothetical protein